MGLNSLPRRQKLSRLIAVNSVYLLSFLSLAGQMQAAYASENSSPNKSKAGSSKPEPSPTASQAPLPEPSPTPLPEPSAAPQSELPPLAPQLRKAEPAPDSSTQESYPAPGFGAPVQAPAEGQTGSHFSLQAQQFESAAQENLRLSRPLDPRFARPVSGYDARINNNRLQGNVQSQADGRSLTQVELQRLAAHDIVLLVDRSASMAAMDCPSGHVGSAIGLVPSLLGLPLLSTSRWNWCLRQTSELSRQTEGIYAQGITVVLFSTGFVTFPNVRLNDLQLIFELNFPMGGTNLAPALATQIGEYFQRRQYNRGNVKPLMIGIITDGCPTSRNAVRSAIIDATRLMRSQDEISIIFFLVGGMDFMGTRFVNDLCTNLVSQGAVYPIVKEVSFEELQKSGLAKAIADKLQ